MSGSSEKWPPCKWCGSQWEPVVNLCEKGPHYAEKRCGSCGKHLGWVPKPDRDKSRREAKHTDLVRKYFRGFCDLCLITEKYLPHGEVWEAHHVLEYQNGGGAERENVWILCTACHKLVNWRRIYLRHLLPEGVVDVDP